MTREGQARRRERALGAARAALDAALASRPGADAPWAAWVAGERRCDAARRRVERLSRSPIEEAVLAGLSQHEEGWA